MRRMAKNNEHIFFQAFFDATHRNVPLRDSPLPRLGRLTYVPAAWMERSRQQFNPAAPVVRRAPFNHYDYIFEVKMDWFRAYLRPALLSILAVQVRAPAEDAGVVFLVCVTPSSQVNPALAFGFSNGDVARLRRRAR